MNLETACIYRIGATFCSVLQFPLYAVIDLDKICKIKSSAQNIYISLPNSR